MADFEGKVVLVTGAAGGIGEALCRYFAGRGAVIAALDRRAEVHDLVAGLAGDGVTAAGAEADVGSIDQVRDAVEALFERVGPVDVLVNNAGYSDAANLEKTTPEIWADNVNGNLNGVYNCTTCVLPRMQARGSGAVVNIGSVNGLAGYGDPAYSAAKAGIISYTRSLAMEYGRFGIRANVVCPGTVRTPAWDLRVERDPDVLANLEKWYPLGRVAEPIDVARAVAFLASDDAAAITGAMLPVDCGLTAGNIVMTREVTLEDI